MKEIETHHYTGRVDDPDMKERIHQHISGWTETVRGDAPVFIGFRSDEGVRRNQGRPGAHLGRSKCGRSWLHCHGQHPSTTMAASSGTRTLKVPKPRWDAPCIGCSIISSSH
ncbi:hypothetical protein [Salinicoccus sp. CNSTN-B1]